MRRCLDSPNPCSISFSIKFLREAERIAKEKQSSTGSAPSGKKQCVIFTAADGGDDRARTQEIEQEGQERIPGLAARNGRALWPRRYNGDQALGRRRRLQPIFFARAATR